MNLTGYNMPVSKKFCFSNYSVVAHVISHCLNYVPRHLKKIITLNYAEVARIVAEVTPETNFELSSDNKCTWLNI